MNRRSFLRPGSATVPFFSNATPALKTNAGGTYDRTPGSGQQFMPIQRGSLAPFRPPSSAPWDTARAAHLLRRTGFGVTGGEVDAALKSTPAEVVQGMLASPSTPPPPGSWTTQQPFTQNTSAELSQYYKWLQDLQHWWYNLMIQPGGMLREKMVLFWHNHFVSDFPTVLVTQYTYIQNQLFRDNAFGDFRDLAKKVTVDPAMLIYLNGASSKAGNPNENYARELMELFTLGVGDYSDGTPHYTEADIIELARALTGWTVSGLGSQFMPQRFDNNPKTIFGLSQNFGVNGKTPYDVIDHIFSQVDPDLQRKRAAVFICSKLYQNFVYQVPNMDIVAGMAQTLEQNNWQIGPVLQELLTSDHFFDDNVIGARIKSPAEFAIGGVRELHLTPTLNGANVDPTHPETHDPLTAMSFLSQTLFYPPNVKGWIGGRTWLSSSTVPLRIRYSKLWIEPPSGALPYGFDPVAFVKTLPAPNDVDMVLDSFTSLLLPLGISADERAILLDELLAGGKTYEWDPDAPNAASRIRACLIRIINLGEYQLV